MISTISLTSKAEHHLTQRGFNQTQINAFTELLTEAQQAQGKSAIAKLQSLSQQELNLLQKAHSLADSIKPHQLSEEGAKNLLNQPDNRTMVDLNNDGVVEVGVAQTIVFPPINTPNYVKVAWDEATQEMSDLEKSSAGFEMMFSIYGAEFVPGEGLKIKYRPQKWDQTSRDNLFTKLASQVKFLINYEGVSDRVVKLQTLHNNFEQALNKHANFSSAKEGAAN